jgi:phospholipid transport system substrate-binding protein
MNTIAGLLLSVTLIALSAAGRAADGPDELIKSAVNDLLVAYEAEKNRIEEDPRHLRAIIEEHILPHIDFELMSKLVLGKHRRRATKEQLAEFTDGFRELLIRTYTTTLSEYSGQTVRFLPFHPGEDPERASVDTEIVARSGPPIPVSYRLRRKDGDGWMVYDFSIDGLSLVGNYRSAFSSEISRSGLDKLISALSERELKQ